MKRSARLWRGYLYVLAWSLGTACAAAIAWQGVSNAYDLGDRAGAPVILAPRSVGTTAPSYAPYRPAPPESSGRPAPSPPGAARQPAPTVSPPVAGAPEASRTRTYRLAGGIVVLTETNERAELGEVRPAPGWTQRFWLGIGWLRVDFTKGDRATTLIATWNGHPPNVLLNNGG